MSSFFVIQIRDCLEVLNLGRFADAFEDLGWDDIELWPEMTDEELRECGLKTGHIKKFRKYVANLN